MWVFVRGASFGRRGVRGYRRLNKRMNPDVSGSAFLVKVESCQHGDLHMRAVGRSIAFSQLSRVEALIWRSLSRLELNSFKCVLIS